MEISGNSEVVTWLVDVGALNEVYNAAIEHVENGKGSLLRSNL